MTGFSFKIGDGDHAQLEERLRGWLGFTADMRKPKEGHLYGSTEELVLKNGEVWHDNLWEMDCEDAPVGQCFNNVFNMLPLLPNGTHYVEGWGLMPFGIPAHHAWAVLPDGRVLDPTWKNLYRRYRERSEAEGSKQPYSGKAVYIGVRIKNRRAHIDWANRRRYPNTLALMEMDIREVLKFGTDAIELASAYEESRV